ncbi:MAG: ATP-binding protein [Candidatus Goldbacteria bacterium]|nr:ATP-binding protein [Candidatus Goldiibacteriota bacterium]
MLPADRKCCACFTGAGNCKTNKERIIMSETRFKVRARLLQQIGEQLIKNESIALIELVKNAYDADASEVNVIMKEVDNSEKGQIVIEDNGCGMNMDIIKNVWFEAGTDFKNKMTETPKYKRHPLGEKGIGRFAIHKLGNKIELISRQSNKKEIYFSFNWNTIKQYKYIEEIPVSPVEREPEIFKGDKTGTRIIITSLKNKWERGSIRDLYRSIIAFNNPFSPSSDFKVSYYIDKSEWIQDLLTPDKVKDYALYYVEAELEGDRIKKFKYEFRPYSIMNKLQKRFVNETDKQIAKVLKMVDRDNKSIDLNNYKIGNVNFTAYIFDRETKILKLGLTDIKGLKEYLNLNGGIRIYRDGIRVYDYGEPENDWLELDIRRVNVPAKRISNNLILGAIELNRERSKDLIEKTNREGFIENEAYLTFKSAILYLLNVIEGQRNIDKEKIRLFYGTKEKSQPVIASINELKSVIEEKIKDDSIRNEITRYLNKIEKEYENISEILLRSAGAGLNLSVVIHEMEKILEELKKIIEKEKVNERIITLVKHLSNLVEGYTALIRRSENKKEDLIKIIDQTIFNMEYRLKYHKIILQKEYQNYKGDNKIPVVRNLMLNSIMNIIDNSIWWLDYSKKDKNEEKKLFINLIDRPEGYLSIIIADNGSGFTLPAEEIIKPFVSAKPDGMGLGLHIVSEVIEAHKGLLLFPDDSEIDDYNIPFEYKSGAIIVLSLRRE